MGITVRIGVASDADALAELAARTFEETFGADNRPEDMALHLAAAARLYVARAWHGQGLAQVGFTDAGSHVFMVGTDPQVDRVMVREVPA